MRILLADDHDLVRETLAAFLLAEGLGEVHSARTIDEVLALRVERDAEGVTQRALMCDSDGIWLAKDRSGKLEAWEAPDLGGIITKIGGKQ